MKSSTHGVDPSLGELDHFFVGPGVWLLHLCVLERLGAVECHFNKWWVVMRHVRHETVLAGCVDEKISHLLAELRGGLVYEEQIVGRGHPLPFWKLLVTT